VFDFEYTHQCQGTSEASKKEKLFLMSWCPDSAKIKKKMLYSSSFDALKKCLVGVQKFIQVSFLPHTAETQYQDFERNFPRKGIARPQSPFPLSCVCER
jgi:cofilin